MKEKVRKELLPILSFVRIDIKRLFRDKVAIFFVFVFPLIFLFVFGGIFGRESDVSFTVGLLNRSDSEFAIQFEERIADNELFEVDEEVSSLDDAREKMNRGEIDATIILPDNFGRTQAEQYPTGEATVLYDQGSEQAGQALTSVLEGIFDQVNNEIIPVNTPFSVRSESTATAGLSSFDYIFSGLLGFSILSLGIFGPTTIFPRLKQRGVLRRYHSTPLKVWQYFSGNVLSNAFVGLLSVASMILVALVVFDLNMRGSYINLAVVVIFGAIAMFGIGLAAGGWAKNENQAAPLANLITFPMMFLSGVFFPRFLMPEWLQAVSGFIPLTPIVESFRLIITENASLMDVAPEIGMILGWAVIVYVIAFKVFRWE